MEKNMKKATKKRGKTEVYPFWNLEDIKKMMDYFLFKKQYHHYLTFMFGLLLGRRIGDTLSLSWSNFYEENGRKKEHLAIKEEKTGKDTRTYICKLCWDSIALYIEKTGINPSENNYKKPIFISNSNRKDAAYRTAFKKAAEEVGITYPVSTHSTRKTFGYWSMQTHPHDVNSLDILQRFFGHSDRNITSHYIGLTREQEDQYVKDNGNLMEDVKNGRRPALENLPVITLQTQDLRDIIQMAYMEGKNNTAINDTEEHLDAINTIMNLIDEMRVGIR